MEGQGEEHRNQEAEEHAANATFEPGQRRQNQPPTSAGGFGHVSYSTSAGGSDNLRPLNKYTAQGLAVKSIEARHKKMSERHERIIEWFAEHTHKPTIGNRDVQLLLHVSDATAQRYLKELKKEARLETVGRGRFLRYKLTQ